MHQAVDVQRALQVEPHLRADDAVRDVAAFLVEHEHADGRVRQEVLRVTRHREGGRRQRRLARDAAPLRSACSARRSCRARRVPTGADPPTIGIGVPVSLRPIVRLKNGTRSLVVLTNAVLALVAPPIWNAPWFSRKNSRFSGKNRLKRVRFTCCVSTSTCEKSVRHVPSSTRFDAEADLHVDAAVADASRCDAATSRHLAEHERLHADVPPGLDVAQPVEHAGVRHLELVELPRHRVPDRLLVAVADQAEDVHAPHLVALAREPQLLERDGLLDDEPVAPRRLDRHVHTPSQFALMYRPSSDDCESRSAQPGIGLEVVGVQPVAERVEQQHHEVAVARDEVALQFVDDQPVDLVLA